MTSKWYKSGILFDFESLIRYVIRISRKSGLNYWFIGKSAISMVLDNPPWNMDMNDTELKCMKNGKNGIKRVKLENGARSSKKWLRQKTYHYFLS